MLGPLATAALLLACSGQAEAELAQPAVGDPSIRIEEPAAASYIAVGTHTLSGSGVDLVSVEVTPSGGVVSPTEAEHVDAAFSGGRFEADVEARWGVNTYEALGTDAGGDTWLARRSVLAGTFSPAEGLVGQAAAFRIEADAFDTLANFVEGALDPIQLSAAMKGGPAVFEESFGILGLDAVSLSASVGSIDFDRPDLGVDPAPGALQMRLVLPAVQIELPVEGTVVGIGFDTHATVGCDQAIIAADVRFGTDGSGGLDIEVLDPTIELLGFWYDVSLLPGDAVEGLFTSNLQGILEDELVAQVQAGLPTLLDAALAGLQQPTELAFLDLTASLTPAFRSATVDNDGLAISIDLDVQVPIAGTKSAPGYLRADAGLPPLTGVDLGMIASDDLVNRILFELWAGGVLDLTLDGSDGLLDPALFEELGGHNGGSITLDARLPPVLVQENGQPRLQVGEWLVRIDTPDGDNGEFLELACALSAGIDMEVAGGSLLGTVTEPQVSYIVRDTDWTARPETITRLVEDQLPVDELLGLLGTIAFPIPAIGGFTLDEAAIDRGQGGASTTISLDL